MRDLDFNRGWVFTQEGTSRREEVTLPHDAMLHTKRNPKQPLYFLLAGFEAGKYIYTKQFQMGEDEAANTHLLEFEGVYCNATVTVNGKEAARHVYGYTPFLVDLDPFLRFGTKNEIQVMCDVPKEGHNRWYTGGGIYRPVHLYVGAKAYFLPNQVRVTTLGIHPAKIRVEALVHQGDGMKAVVKIRPLGIYKGEEPWSSETFEKEHEEEENILCAQETIPVYGDLAFSEILLPDATLWSAAHPYLYEAELDLVDDGGRVVDHTAVSFGVRQIRVDAEQGLLVNEEPTFLRGGCIHNDNGILGVVNNDATEWHRARALKASGFNAIRSAHHPMSRSLMQALDRVGMYVMDEAFDYWYRPKTANPYGEVFLEYFEEDARKMAEDAYNHPCVILYSIGNEIPEAGSVKGVKVARRILEAIHRVDTTRPATLCPSVHWLREYLDGTPYLEMDEDQWIAQDPESRTKEDFRHYAHIFMGAAANLPDNEKNLPYPPTYVRMDEAATQNLYPYLDVAGYNYYEDRYETLHGLHPERVLLGTETRAFMITETMKFAKDHPYLIGDFIWTLQDHLGEVNCGGLSYRNPEEPDKPVKADRSYPWLVNACGILDLTGRIRPLVHKFEFAWEDFRSGGGKTAYQIYPVSQPPVHGGMQAQFVSDIWTDTEDSWSFEGYEGAKTRIGAYTNAAAVRFEINGKVVGEAQVEENYCEIPAVYERGTLTAIGVDETGRELCRGTLQSAGEETRLHVTCDRSCLISGCEDYAFLKIEVADDMGIVKCLPETDVFVRVEGNGTLAGLGSANPIRAEGFDQNHTETFLGRAQAAVRSGDASGDILVTVSAEGMEDRRIRIRTRA